MNLFKLFVKKQPSTIELFGYLQRLEEKIDSLQQTVDSNNVAVNDSVQMVGQAINDLQGEIEQAVVLVADDFTDNVKENIKEFIDPIMEKNNKDMDECCKKMVAFLLKYLKVHSDKIAIAQSAKPIPIPIPMDERSRLEREADYYMSVI